MDELRDACRAWQGGMEGGSSPIRAAARNLTGVKHYFDAPFIRAYEEDARASDVTTRRAVVLLTALAESPLRTPTEWGDALGTGSVWVGRGIKRGTDDQDGQIQASLKNGELTMPLWGTSLDPVIAASYGGRYTFELEGPFPAIPAWILSGIKDQEAELICGGRYRIAEAVDFTTEPIVVRLQFQGLAA